MAGATYHQFDINLQLEGNQLLLRREPGIQHEIPFGEFEQQCDEKFGGGTVTLKEQTETGQWLFDTLFPPAHPLREAFLKAIGRNQRMRLRLLYPADPGELLKIPWEHLYVGPDQPDRLSGFLCQHSDFSLVHCLHKIDGNKPASLPLKVAFLSALEDAEASLTNMNRLLEINSGLITSYRPIIQISRHAEEIQRTNFRSALKNDGVAQLLIHGSDDAIYFRGEDGEITGHEIMAMLEDIANHEIRAVVLCACEAANDGIGPAIQLHKTGIPVVIGFRKVLSIVKAIRFMEDFYSEFVNTAGKVEEALAFARSGLIYQDDGVYTTIAADTPLSLDWGVPRIFLTRAHGDLIPEELLYRPLFSDISDRFTQEIERRLKKASPEEEVPLGVAEYPPELDEWLKGSQRIHYLYGPSGSGKSTQIARFIKRHREDKKILYHLCTPKGNQTDDENANHPLIFIRDSVYPRLEALFGKKQYRAWVGHHYPYLINDARDALNQLVIEPLRRARNSPKWKQPVLIIDGLDHSETFEPGYTILDLLSDFIQPLTEVIRLLITATSDTDQNEVHQRILNLVGENAAQKMPVNIDWQKIQNDIHEKLPEHLKPVFSEFLEKCKRAGQINYQFVSFLKRIDHPELMEMIIRNSLSQENYLESAYQITWEFLKRQNNEEKVQIEKLLKVLGAAYAPLSERMLAKLIDVNTEKVSSLLSKISYFIQREADGVSCEHPSIKQYLEMLPSKENPHRLFLEMYRNQTDGIQPWEKIDDGGDPSAIHYAAKYFAEHAYQYCIEERGTDFKSGQDEYLRLMLSPSFRNFRKKNAGEAAIEDIRRSLRVFYIKTAIGELESQVTGLRALVQTALFRRKSIPVEKVWEAGNRLLAAPAIEQFLGTAGRSANPHLIALETELCNQNERGDLFKPLQKYWSSYYPSLFEKKTQLS